VDGDGLNGFILKKLSASLGQPLSLLCSLSLYSGVLPTQFLPSITTPIFKGKGSPRSVANYRPIAKLSALSKVCEIVVANQLSLYLETNNLLSPVQYGFRRRHSTTGQVLKCLDIYTASLSRRVPMDTILLDFRKAFDSVPHPKLLLKLASLGISDCLLTWFGAYLADRTQSVTVDGSVSESRSITSGVLQGSTLGPTLFLCYINDLISQLISTGVHVYVFADDIKIFSDSSDKLCAALVIVESWCGTWQMSLAVPKCVVFGVGGGLGVNYVLNGLMIPNPTGPCRDLGFLISPSLSFSCHAQSIVAKARRASYIVFKSFTTGRVDTMTSAYTVFVRPLLEYGTCVFNSISKRDSDMIERVQKSVTRLIYRRCKLPRASYLQRIDYLGLGSLNKRRLVSDLCFAHKVYTGKHVCSDVLRPKVNQRVLTHNCRLLNEPSAVGCRNMYWSNRVVKFWNRIPEAIITAKHAIFVTYLNEHIK
jgi:hypothetical protein